VPEVKVIAGDFGSFQWGWLFSTLQNLISNGIARIAVPLFYLISGYLFFINFNGSFSQYRLKLKSRLSTLLIPYLIWNLLAIFILLLLHLLPEVQNILYSSNSRMYLDTNWSVIDKIVGLSGYPAAYQFWFIRDLMVVILLAPLIHTIFRKYSSLLIVVTGVLWYLQIWPISIPSSTTVFFFILGAGMTRGDSLFEVIDKYRKPGAGIFITILLLDTYSHGFLINEYIHRLEILIGCFVVLQMSGVVSENHKINHWLVGLSKYSFFVFAVHEPMLTIIRKFVLSLFEHITPLALFSIYLFLPLIVVALSIYLYKFITLLSPKLIGLISGHRLDQNK
jgi:peptidoglycan/LPS O-acetylase OafA/YrhL